MGFSARMIAAALVAAFAGSAAQAQVAGEFFQRDRNVSVLERPKPEYEAGGVRSGAFILRPSLEVGAEYNDNIFAAGSNEESDIIARFAPALMIDTTWSRHDFTADASAERREYLDFSDESVWNATAGAAARIDVQRGFFLEAGGRYSDLTEDRVSAGLSALAAEPIEFDVSSFNARAVRESGRVRLEGGLEFETFDFDDAVLFGGGVGDQDFRDRDVTTAMARLDVAVTPDTAVFARISANERDYDLSPPVVAFDRSSDGYTVDAGADFDIGGVARGEVALGYTEQDYDSPILPDVDGLSVNAQVEWFPTQLTTVTVAAERGIEDAAIINSGAFIATEASVQVDHELLRNVILTGRLGFGEDDYEGVDRSDERFEALASATYLANRNVGVRASFNHLDYESSGAFARPDFDENRFVVSVEFRL